MRADRSLILLALAALAVAGCSSKADEDQQAQVTPITVKLTAAQRAHVHLFTVGEGTYAKIVDAPGIVDFDNDQATSVIAPFSGPVAQMLVNPGDHVRKGQALAYVESADFSAAAGAYAKALSTARTNRKLADMDKDLLAHNGVAQKEAQQAETDAETAEADRDSALRALVAVGAAPETIRMLQAGQPVAKFLGVIRSPINGTVADKLVTPGMLVQAGTTPCFTIADLSKVWVMTQVPEADLSQVRVGESATVLGDATSSGFLGVVNNVASEVSPDTRAVIARVVVNNPGEYLKKQMYVRVQIRSNQTSSGLLIPVAAVLHDDENLPFVFVAQADGSLARRHVTLGDRTGDSYAVTSGLGAGERIVDDGGIFLQFMQSQ
jgi:cobalt-zinc-cadmium efflux system membrane fusion protein